MTVEDERTPGKKSALNKAADMFEENGDEILSGDEVAARLRQMAREQ